MPKYMTTIIAIILIIVGLGLLVYLKANHSTSNSNSITPAEFVSLNPSDNNSTQAGKVHVMYVVSRMISGPVLNNDGTSKPIGTAGYVFYEFVVSKSPFTRADIASEDKFSSGELVKTGFSVAYYRSQDWGGNGFALGVRNYIIEVQEEDADEFLENRSEQRLTPMRIKVQEQ